MKTPDHGTAVLLKPLSQAAFDAWLPAQSAAYAADKVRAGNWPEAGALARAQQEMRKLLPQGLATPEHLLFAVVDAASGQAVGIVWVKLSPQGKDAFIYNIEVDEERRGRGYGTAALQELERVMAGRGMTRLMLHVFGFNQGAQRLYQRLGFEVTNINMVKSLRRNG